MFKNGKITGDTKFQIGIEGIPDIPSAMVPIQYHDKRGNTIDYFVLLIKRLFIVYYRLSIVNAEHHMSLMFELVLDRKSPQVPHSGGHG